MSSEPALLAHLGVSESGKTYALQRCVREEVATGLRRFLVVDVNGEWPGACRVERYGEVSDADGARLALDNGERVVVMKNIVGNRIEVGEKLAALAFERGCILVVSEAQFFIPERGTLADAYLDLATGWRHRGAGLWIDSTRPALVSKTALDLCRRWRLFPLAARDRKWARELGGQELVDVLMFAARKLAPADHGGGSNEPGWHVQLDPRTLIPPFRAVRFAR